MAIKNKTKYAILGVLSMKPCSGYDIKKFCDKSISYFWNENFGHIYPVLSQLEKDGMIALKESDGDDRKKIYSVTEKGMEEFKDWLLQPVEYQPARSELLLKLVFAENIPVKKTIEMMEEVRERKKLELKNSLEIEASYNDTPGIKEKSFYHYWLAPLRYSIFSTKAIIKWCDETIESLKKSQLIK